ncbi:MAG TPA: DUF1223 domain-containing protein [Terrimicrobiaceae bacterium]
MKLMVILSIAALSHAASAGDATIQSGPALTHLLELYTSEGCSSCPPAERWMSQLKQSPRLWKEIVPVAFHVDYWDQLGWRDRFASKDFTSRQRAYAAAWASDTIYTPEFVLDGREWRERSLDQIGASAGNAGVLTARIRNRTTVAVTYQPARAGEWEAHAALLGFGLSSSVNAGENSGRKLLHDFVVLEHQVRLMLSDDGSARAEFTLETPESGGELGLSVWVTEAGKSQPVQALGGILPP